MNIPLMNKWQSFKFSDISIVLIGMAMILTALPFGTELRDALLDILVKVQAIVMSMIPKRF